MSSKLYSARNQHIAIVDDQEHGADGVYRCDITSVLFYAQNDEEAFQRALYYGSCQEHEYLNSGGQRVRWAFRKVEQIYRLIEPLEGLEIGSVLAFEDIGKKLDIDSELVPSEHRPYFDDGYRVADDGEDIGSPE